MPWKNLSFNIDKCVGCRICELACSIEKLGKINPRKARLHAIYDYPFDAIKRDNRTGAWIVDSTKCIGCGACVEACPFGVITVSSDNNVAVKCDLCNGNPQCVLWCPTGALTYGLKERLTQERRENFAKKYTSLLKPQKFRATLNGGKSYDARAKASNE
jgi:carbon-monoxide dehydrogenase iron sulfur subunit